MVTWAEIRLQEQDHFLFCFDSTVRIVNVRVRVFGVGAFLITPSEPKLACPLWALLQGAIKGLEAATSWQKESCTSLGHQWGFYGLVLPMNHCDMYVFITFAFIRMIELLD